MDRSIVRMYMYVCTVHVSCSKNKNYSTVYILVHMFSCPNISTIQNVHVNGPITILKQLMMLIIVYSILYMDNTLHNNTCTHVSSHLKVVMVFM